MSRILIDEALVSRTIEAIKALSYYVPGEVYEVAKDTERKLRQTLEQRERPPREWVGLTDQDVDAWNIFGGPHIPKLVRAVEKKLKEKNT